MSPFDMAWVFIALANYHLGPTPKAVPWWLLMAVAALILGVLEKWT